MFPTCFQKGLNNVEHRSSPRRVQPSVGPTSVHFISTDNCILTYWIIYDHIKSSASNPNSPHCTLVNQELGLHIVWYLRPGHWGVFTAYISDWTHETIVLTLVTQQLLDILPLNSLAGLACASPPICGEIMKHRCSKIDPAAIPQPTERCLDHVRSRFCFLKS